MIKLKKSIAKGIGNIVFDFGGVLIDIDPDRTVKALKELGLEHFKESDVHPNNTGPFLDVELGTISQARFVEALRAMIPAGNTVPTETQLLDAWNAMLLDYDWSRFELLDELREAGYRVFLLSNTNQVHRDFYIAKFDRENPARRSFESYFDRCFYSDVMHLRKPDPAIYTTMMEQANIHAQDSIFIDDNKMNTDAAEKVGMAVYNLRPPMEVFELFERFTE